MELPKEIWAIVLQFLDFEDLLALSLVCKQLYEYFIKEVYRFPKFKRDLKSLVKFYNVVKGEPSLASAVETLNFTPVEDRWHPSTKVSLLASLLPNLESLTLDGCFLHHGELSTIASACPHLVVLSLEGMFSTGRKTFCNEIVSVLAKHGHRFVALNFSQPEIDGKNVVFNDSVVDAIGKYCSKSLKTLELRRNIHLDYDLLLGVLERFKYSLELVDLTDTLFHDYSQFHAILPSTAVLS